MSTEPPKPATSEPIAFKKDPAERTQDYDKGLYPSAQELKAAKKTGWLKKQGGAIKTWKYRWCVADAGYFFYYVTENDLKPRGLFRLLDYQNVERADTKIKKKNALMIFNRGSADRCYYMVSEISEDDINSWLKALRTEIKFVVDFVDAKSNLTHATKERPKGPNKRPPTRTGRSNDENSKSPVSPSPKTSKVESKKESKAIEPEKEEPKKALVPSRPTAAKPKRKSTEENHIPPEEKDLGASPTGSPLATSLQSISYIEEESTHDYNEQDEEHQVVSIIEEDEDELKEIQEAKEEIQRLQSEAEENLEKSKVLTMKLEDKLLMLNDLYKDLKDSIDNKLPPEQILVKVEKHRDSVKKFLDEEVPKSVKIENGSKPAPATTITTTSGDNNKDEVKKQELLKDEEETKDDAQSEPKVDSPKIDTPKVDSTKVDSAKDDPKKPATTTTKDAPTSKTDSPKVDSTKVDAAKDDSKKPATTSTKDDLKKTVFSTSTKDTSTGNKSDAPKVDVPTAKDDPKKPAATTTKDVAGKKPELKIVKK
jgi:hypothetical protein